jgi:hypothetical protein
MPLDLPWECGGFEPEWEIEQRINQRTAGNIRRLRVELGDGHILVRGCTTAYYYKQLAMAAVRELFSSLPIDLEIVVLGLSEPLPHYSRKFANRGLSCSNDIATAPDPSMSSIMVGNARNASASDDDVPYLQTPP